MAQTPKSSVRPRSQAKPRTAGSDELTASGEIQLGNAITLKGSARATLAGVICVGMTGVALLAAAALLVHVARR